MAGKIKPFDVTKRLTSEQQIAGHVAAALEEGNPGTIMLVKQGIERARAANAAKKNDKIIPRHIRYAVKLTKDDNGTILATVPDIPEAITFGEDQEDALARAADAIETAIMARIAAREDIPSPVAEGEHYVSLRFLK